MAPFITRDPRTETDLQVRIGVLEVASARMITPMIAGTMKNISTTGACISLSRIIIDNTHLFFATLNNDRNQLILYLALPEEEQDRSNITARPVWMNTWRIDRETEFRIGLEFITKQRELHNIIKKLS